MDFFSILELLLGLSFFLFGMKVMSGNLEKLSGGKLEQLLQKATSNPFVSIILGLVITVAVQSSSATTVMLVGLVNSGIMQFSQTLYVIFGANIGTTLTSWILSLSSIDSSSIAIQMLKPENFSPIIAFIGIIMVMFSKREHRTTIGTIFVGFAVLMYGMEFMKNAVSPLAEIPEFAALLVRFNNPLFGVIVGTLFTALIQSSAASIAILQALSLSGSITFTMAIPIVMGQNIGTCATSLISCIGTNTKAKRVAIVHVMIKIIGTIILLSLFSVLNAIFDFAFANQPVSPMTIAVIHTAYNILTTVILLPFTKLLAKLTEKLVPDKKKAAEKKDDFMLDERLLLSPSVAIVESNNATKRMATYARDSLMLAMGLIYKYDAKKIDEVLALEETIDMYEDKLGTYLVKLSPSALSKSDSQIVSKMLHSIGDFERLGDHAVNLVKTAKEIHEKGISFSDEAKHELDILRQATEDILSIAEQSYINDDIELAGKVEPLEQVIDGLTNRIKDNHISRLRRGDCTIELGFVLSDILTNFERISDHCSNIAVAVIEIGHDSFDTHKYLNGLKYGNLEFNKLYDEYAEKYTL